MAKLKINNNYGVVPNEILNSKDISFKAKGLFAYIQSKPDGWDFSAEKISQQTDEGLASVKSGLKELESNGLLIRKKSHNDQGFFEVEYILCDQPMVEKPLVDNPLVDNPSVEKPLSENYTNNSKKDISKKEYINEITNSKKDNLEKRKNYFQEVVFTFDYLLGDQINNFIDYWTETDNKGNMRFEKEKFFDIKRRINTWISRSYSKNSFNFENKPKGRLQGWLEIQQKNNELIDKLYPNEQ